MSYHVTDPLYHVKDNLGWSKDKLFHYNAVSLIMTKKISLDLSFLLNMGNSNCIV